MFCTKCGKKLNDDAKFCTSCGNTIKDKEKDKEETEVINNSTAKEASTQEASKTMEIHDTCDLSQLETQSVDTSSPEYTFQNVPPVVNSQQDTAQQNYVANDYQQSYQPQYQQNKNNNTALFVILGVLIVVIIAAVLVIFFMIKPFDSSDNTTNTTATKETQTENNSSSNNNNNKSNSNNNNNSSTTNPTSKTVSCTAANGSTLTGTVRLKDGYVIPDSSTRSYSASEIAALGLNDAEMCIAWNEPYARAGYHFKNSGLQAYFNSCSWYHDAGFSGTLSDVGGQNTNTIKSVAGNSAWKNLATY